MNQSNLLRPTIAPSKRGGLVMIFADGSRGHIPDDWVEATIEDMESVRGFQLRRECTAICEPLRFPGAA